MYAVSKDCLNGKKFKNHYRRQRKGTGRLMGRLPIYCSMLIQIRNGRGKLYWTSFCKTKRRKNHSFSFPSRSNCGYLLVVFEGPENGRRNPLSLSTLTEFESQKNRHSPTALLSEKLFHIPYSLFVRQEFAIDYSPELISSITAGMQLWTRGKNNNIQERSESLLFHNSPSHSLRVLELFKWSEIFRADCHTELGESPRKSPGF